MCSHGKARTQLNLVPRSVQRPPSSASASRATTTQSSDMDTSDCGTGETKKMTNADFRNMLLR